jgi:thioredoxin-dependent peroxiredoxin
MRAFGFSSADKHKNRKTIIEMKKIMSLRKFAFAIMACAFTLNVKAGSPVAPGKMMNTANPPQVGEMAPDFELKTLDDQTVRLSDLTSKSKVVLIELRGWPGYQCPLCTRQVHDYVRSAEKFKDVQVLMVYPGPADELKAHATEFLKDKSWPKNFLFVLDPDYTFTKSYGLRWDAKSETAYPSTFIIDTSNKVRFAHVSHEHGDRVGAAAALKALQNTM